MPRGKKATTVGTGAGTATTNVVVDAASVTAPSSTGKTKLDTLLLKLRNTCRTHGLQSWNKQSLCDQIYQDLLFLYHLPRLVKEGSLELDCASISDGKLTSISYATLLTLKGDPPTMSNVFKRLWRALQTSFVGSLFKREFAMFSIEKDDKKTAKYYKLLVALFEDMNSVELAEYDSNAGYTYFKKDLNKGTAKTFGQFYTPSSVLKSVVHLVNPQASDLVLDPSCGSCSFLQETANHIAATQCVDAITAFQNLHGIEVERDIYTEGIMNVFINFGIIPDMETHIQEEDAFLELLKTDTRYDKIVANPPFGATVNTFKEFYFQTVNEVKGKRTVKKVVVNPAVKNTIPFPNVGESAILFFQMIVQVLKPIGRAGVVMSSTILNDSYAGMMEWFLNCCALDKIVINPAGTFKEQGTMIETLSFLYTKGSPTTTISVVMLGDEDTVIRTITLDQVREARWKLNVKGEEDKKTGVSRPANPTEFSMVKLGDLYEVPKTTKKFNSGDMDNMGDSAFFNGKWDCPVGTHSEHSFASDKDYFVLIKDGGGDHSSSTVGMGKFFKVRGKCSVTSHNLILVQKKEDDITHRFVYYYMSLYVKALRDKARYSINLGSISMDSIMDFPIQLPPRPIQQEIVATLDRIYAPGTTDLANTLKHTSQAMDLVLATPSGATLEPIVEAQRLIRKSVQMVADVKAQMAAIVKASFTKSIEMSTISNIASIEAGEYITKKDEAQGAYPVYGGGSASYHINRFNREATCVINKDGMSAQCVQLVKDKFFLNHHGWTLKLKSDKLVEAYLHYQLYFRASDLYALATGSCQKGLSQKVFMNFNVYIPPLDFQQSIIARLAALESQVTALESLQRSIEDNARFILESYLGAKGSAEPVAEATAEAGEEEAEEPASNTLTHA